MKKLFVLIILLFFSTLSIAKEIDLEKSKGIEQEVIVSLTPIPASRTVAKDVIIKAVFNVELDEKHLKRHNVKLKRISGKKKWIRGKVSYLADEKTIIFTPKKPLKEGYYKIVFKGLKTLKEHSHNHHKKKKIKKIKYRFYVPKTVPDTKAPVITLNGDSNITLIKGDSYDELGATAFDDVDGNISSNIVIDSSNVNTNVVGIYTVTYNVADAHSNNAVEVRRTVNVVSPKSKITELILSAEKTNFLRKKDVLDNDYPVVISPIKVLANYDDGHSEEITDQVKWNKNQKNIVFGTDYFHAGAGTFKVSASFNGITSNEIIIDIKDEAEKLLLVETKTKGRDATIYITLSQKPIDDVTIKFKLKEEDNVSFKYTDNPLEHEITITPEKYESRPIRTIYMDTKNLDINSTKDYTIAIEPFVSNDPYYDSENPEDILVKYVTKKPRLTAPSLIERRGAIRGVSIKFRVTAQEKHLKYSLINPPAGMKIIKDPIFHLPTGVTVQWDVPMDGEEGKIYTISMKAEDGEYASEISFPIKVPKTRKIATKIENGELTITEQNSPLFGMKFKGHDGEDISDLKLRRVDVGDVWKKHIKKESLDDVVEKIVFIIDNIKAPLDMKFPKYLDNYEKRIQIGSQFFGYSEQVYLGSTLWDSSSRDSYKYEGTKIGLVLPSIELDFNSSKVFMFINTKAQKRGI